MKHDPEEKVVFEGTEEEARHKMAGYTRRGVIWTAVAGVGAYLGDKLLAGKTTSEGAISTLEDGPLRGGLQRNETVVSALFSDARLEPEHSPSEITEARVNGDVGLGDDFDPVDWELELHDGSGGKPKYLSMHDIRALPKKTMTTDFRCIEGWDYVVTWAGAPLAEFARKYAPDGPKKRYVSLETPDGGYYVGLDMASAMHPQTLLAFELNGKPLELEHGAPLRLAIPVKYGVKNLKRIGKIEFTDARPKDYWAEMGYDWYAGL